MEALLNTPSIAADLIFGAQGIASTLGLSRRQVYHAAAAGHIPVFRIGGTICARRTTLMKWFADKEAACTSTQAAEVIAGG